VSSTDATTVGVLQNVDGAFKALRAARQVLDSGAAAPDMDDLMELASLMAATGEQLMAVNHLMVDRTRRAEQERARRRALGPVPARSPVPSVPSDAARGA
jgi:hypothetical protein